MTSVESDGWPVEAVEQHALALETELISFDVGPAGGIGGVLICGIAEESVS